LTAEKSARGRLIGYNPDYAVRRSKIGVTLEKRRRVPLGEVAELA
jgi:hypothetical protein